MRGEQYLAQRVEVLEQCEYICLPGTHFKMDERKGRWIDSFATFMTGEMFE